MGDLISRQAAIDIIEDFPHGDVWNVESMEEMVDRIKQLPPIQQKLLQPWEVLVAQAVLPQPEIIRCKDCKYLFNKDDEGGKCWHFNGFPKVVSYDDFCSRAERREVTT